MSTPIPAPKNGDTCAPDVILREAGGLMSDCWGRALRYNQPDIIRRFGVLASNRVPPSDQPDRGPSPR